MSVFYVRVVVDQICDLIGRVPSQPTLSKWKRVVGLPRWAETCDLKTAEYLMAAALLRAECPTKALTLREVISYLCANRSRIGELLGGVPRIQPALEGEYSWDETATFIRDHSKSHQCPSINTMVNWCKKLGIFATYSESFRVPASTVYRLIDHADVEAKARVQRGRMVGQLRQMKTA